VKLLASLRARAGTLDDLVRLLSGLPKANWYKLELDSRTGNEIGSGRIGIGWEAVRLPEWTFTFALVNGQIRALGLIHGTLTSQRLPWRCTPTQSA